MTTSSSLNQDHPLQLFEAWFQEAKQLNSDTALIATLATANKQGRPSARMIHYKGIKQGGFSFYTNYESQKGQELKENPYAALVFHWIELRKQIRVEGKVILMEKQGSDHYFQSRSRPSQLSTWASKQSKIVPNRSCLEEQVSHFENKFLNQNIPRPSYWGGFIILPQKIEFWTGKLHRLHDRICYTKNANVWEVNTLSP